MSEFQIKNDSTNHQYFAMTPHIIYEIGLKANEIAVYGAIKRCSGENGICIKSKANLAKSAGVCPRTIFNIIQKLCEVNKILGKPLIKSAPRYTEDGDFDTNQIEIIDIWPENMNQFKKIIGKANNALPHATNASPNANNAGGVMQQLPEGHATVAYKEEPLKKNPFKKTTTTPTPSKGKAEEDVVSKNKITTKDREAAKSLKDWLDKEAFKERRRKSGRYYEDVQWGDAWIIPLHVFEMLIVKYGLIYFKEQLENMHRQQMDFDKGISKKTIGKPETVLKMSCKNNYAEYVDLK
jgi:hypothetical protein